MGANDLPNPSGLDLNVSRWGNSLAVRLPMALARSLGITEGDVLHLQPNDQGIWQMSAQRQPSKLSKQELMDRLRKHLNNMPHTESVIAELRSQARY